ncbi:hypothetical protein [Mesorhizobium sp. INR15]|uniref:hypothetical protein n=1 Tax=Mesorhizobium sp. INR15 TaxID=2654248 RepID=UPI00189656C6|nr:hypothetical protein [Mesorhizobium sp. INR15]QPC90774.1 hypothetical protein GA829_09390 [Mesorhizobium sp. INR15]
MIIESRQTDCDGSRSTDGRLDVSIRTFPHGACVPILKIETKSHGASHCALWPYDMNLALSGTVQTPPMAGQSIIGRATAMAEETGTGPQALVPANDNGDLASPEGCPKNVATTKLDRVVLDIARLIGRQLAREAFEAGMAANDNRPSRREGEGREPDGKPLEKKREDLPP